MIKESIYKAGIVAEPTPMDFTLFYKNAMDHNFDGMMGGWGGSASYSNPMQLWHTSSWVTKGSNFCGFGDAESDALIEQANLTLDRINIMMHFLNYKLKYMKISLMFSYTQQKENLQFIKDLKIEECIMSVLEYY